MGAKAQYAYDKGFTGKGVTVAVIDTGIKTDSPEFAGRISSASKSFESSYVTCMTCAPEKITYDLNDKIGHGTAVTAVLAGAKNDSGTHGVAYDSTILALKIVAPNLDTGGPGTPPEGGVNGQAVAPAIRYAVEQGAFAINLSVNGTANGFIATEQRSAMDFVRANNRLVIQSVDNGAGDSFAGTMTQNLVGADLANKGWFLFAIGLDKNLAPRTVNGTPGALADRTLSVVANGIQMLNLDGTYSLGAGNSFAAPGG